MYDIQLTQNLSRGKNPTFLQVVYITSVYRHHLSAYKHLLLTDTNLGSQQNLHFQTIVHVSKDIYSW